MSSAADQLPTNDPRRYTGPAQTQLADLAEQWRAELDRFDDPRARALFETGAEVLLGLRHAFADFEEGTELAWRSA